MKGWMLNSVLSREMGWGVGCRLGAPYPSLVWTQIYRESYIYPDWLTDMFPIWLQLNIIVLYNPNLVGFHIYLPMPCPPSRCSTSGSDSPSAIWPRPPPPRELVMDLVSVPGAHVSSVAACVVFHPYFILMINELFIMLCTLSTRA